MRKKLFAIILIFALFTPIISAKKHNNKNPYRSYKAYKRVYDLCYYQKTEIRLINNEFFCVDYNEIYDPTGLFNDRYYGAYSPKFWIHSLKEALEIDSR